MWRAPLGDDLASARRAAHALAGHLLDPGRRTPAASAASMAAKQRRRAAPARRDHEQGDRAGRSSGRPSVRRSAGSAGSPVTGLARRGPPALQQLRPAARTSPAPPPARCGRSRAGAARRAWSAGAARRPASGRRPGACRTATAGQSTTSPSSAGPGSASSGPRAVSSSSIGKASTSVGPVSPIHRSCSSAHVLDVDAQHRQLGQRVDPHLVERVPGRPPASSASSTSIPDSLATSMVIGRVSSPAGAASGAAAGPARRGTARSAAWPAACVGVPALVGVDDVADQPVPDHVGAGQLGEVHVLDAVEDLPDHPQPAAARRRAGRPG